LRIFELFAKSPFKPLKELLAKVDGCVMHIKPMIEANFARDYDRVKEHFREITIAEHDADQIKVSIRDSLPRSIFLPIDRWHFLEMISSADKIADRVEDLAYMLTIRHTVIPAELEPHFQALTDKALECYARLMSTTDLFDELINAGFSGPVADDVLAGIDNVSHLEWETDKLGYKLSQYLFEMEDQLSPIDVIMIHNIARVIQSFADSVETHAKQLRRTLAR
jgi:predicted phosphate transport protein (TIGR00153 family)